jgi:ATP-binding cassette subfamily A (ABC1) protein 3
MNTEPSQIPGMTVGTAIGMFVFDTFLYLLLAVYFNRVVPNEWGVNLPWYFCCSPAWCCPKTKADDSGTVQVDSMGSTHEPVSASIPVGVSLKRLRKEFAASDGQLPFVAVDSINLNFLEGQVTALLGHNGAGKTTTINMLCGMLPPSSGDARVYGKSINTELDAVRSSLGVCPQHDILFDMLTVTEHLELYAHIKGADAEQIPGMVAEIIAQVGLTEKAQQATLALSGGMKRKLSVGIALIGGSKVVFLDEPTSGMDPFSRRSTWEMLKQAKKDRVIILTTHFMDEADQLGDRIAIMAHGEVKCCGSSLFLKSLYGVGYTFTVVKRPNAFQVDMLHSIVTRNCEGAEVLSDAAGEVSYRLPLHCAPKFPEMFDALDELKARIGFDSYGVSVTTLEEVFLRVGRGDAATVADRGDNMQFRRSQSGGDEAAAAAASGVKTMYPPSTTPPGSASRQGSSPSPSGGKNFDVKIHDTNGSIEMEEKGKQHRSVDVALDESLLFDSETLIDRAKASSQLNHIRAMIMKRFHSQKRDQKVFLSQMLYPFLVMLLGVGLLFLGSQFGTQPYLVLGTQLVNAPLPVPASSAEAYSQQSLLASARYAVKDVAVNNATAMDQWLLDNWRSEKQTKYIAFQAGNPVPFQSSPQSAPIQPTWASERTYFFNSTCINSLPMALNMGANGMLAKLTGSADNTTITVASHPYPPTNNQVVLSQSIVSLFISIAFCWMPASWIAYVVREREFKSKHQQIISGVNFVAYWFATMVADFISYLVPMCLALVIVAIPAFNLTNLQGENAGAFVVAMLLYATSVAPFTYIFSFLFNNDATAQNVALMIYIVCGGVLLIASIIMQIIPSTQSIDTSLRYLYRFFPPYAFGECISNLMVRKSTTVFGTQLEVWDFNVVGRPMLYMGCLSVGYFVLLLLIEFVIASPDLASRLCACLHTSPDAVADGPAQEDDDALAEAARVLDGQSEREGDMVRLYKLRKVYGSRGGAPAKAAVRDLSFGIKAGECFGFLGINGAGKTTTMRMLTGDELPSRGTARLNNMDILTNQLEVRRLVGYCPQFDALIHLMTARETLTMYADIKGVRSDRLDEYVSKLITKLGLDEYADKPCGTYSGGNKRKLSVGIALVGSPPIVFLDEPSTGMDPQARRSMWNLIASTMKGRSVILTTHSMDECEALCQRIGIMVSGALRCVGTGQHLKSRYGAGYELNVRISEDKLDGFKSWIGQVVPGATLQEDQKLNLKYRLPKGVLSLGSIFRIIEQSKVDKGIAEYAVSETSLEQIFIYFAKQQEEEQGPVAGLD